MRLAYLNAIYLRDKTSGGNTHIQQFINNAVAQGHEVWTYPMDQHALSHKLPRRRISKLLTLRRMDAIYVRIEHTVPVQILRLLSVNHKLFRIPLIVWEFNTIPEFGRVVGSTEEQILATIHTFRKFKHRCDLAVCVSREIADYVYKRLGISNTIVIPNGSDPELFRPDVVPINRFGHNPGVLNVVWMGSAHLSWHNLNLLRDAAWIIWDQKLENILFHIIGDKPSNIGEMPQNVNYHGPVVYENLPQWLAAMDVGLCLYHPGPADSNSPIKLFDYMASGLTVVGTTHVQMREVFAKLNQIDLLVPPDDPQILVDVLSKLEQDRDRVLLQGEASRKLVIEHYNWHRAVQDTMKAIDSLLLEKRNRCGVN
jgi:glycosyltransferase involved in cell wall biosynthesis